MATPSPASAGSGQDSPVGPAVTRWVAVAVATVWRDPGRPRPVDLPALAAPAGLREWLSALDVEARKDLVGRIETQVLLGQPVTVLEERDGWARVAVPEQAEPGAPGGYPGWIPGWQLTADPAWAAVARRAGLAGAPAPEEAGEGLTTATVTALTTWLYHRPHPQARWLEVSFGTCLPVLSYGDGGSGSLAAVLDGSPAAGGGEAAGGAEGEWLPVAVPTPNPAPGHRAALTPDAGGGGPARAATAGPAPGDPARHRHASGPIELPAAEDGPLAAGPPTVAWVRRAAVRLDPPRRVPPAGQASPAKVPGTALLETARRFLGLPYLWGGTSGFGVDCSGFVYLVHRFHGLLIPRDAAPQRDHGDGRPVARDRLQPGDLVFFAHDGGKGSVHHVGMYAGDGRMIHAPSSGRVVEEIPLDTPPYGEKYAGARRYHAG
ncbi:C40 family peptidase [Thermaerobacter subterraneus]|uniref:Cell wall-associated hydrolase, invasion-associated protein n=1 Tax=Thermaerobacter subterraneus DSM 13965 TaxID=867903 RepID=K6PR43_9FIRM|nr:cell wall-associated hydrolase, invasion-associated protein [Thermaerobacter subterraneus DSM 13965]